MKEAPRVLYLGLQPPLEANITHYPVIAIFPLHFTVYEKERLRSSFIQAEWVLFTSKSAIDPLLRLLEGASFEGKTVFSVGKKTASALKERGIQVDQIPEEETQEGLIALFKKHPLRGRTVFCGRSSLSRNVLKKFLLDRGAIYFDPVLYETKISYDESNKPSLNDFDEVLFTSPSTVDGFVQAFAGCPLPKNLKLKAIGPVTEKRLEEVFSKC
ncbi:uroporphyrinogen-III synthase [Estrella lausannensis]|uniref:Uroporphyrinogen-III synthase n=1 Tax=Estrella lausannensis TaxID=483423 RepID=A0A0H5E351_9BACT|nr:uroporphyrinogen-III synthase [Estrella lausannensis]CRX37620.1 Uroporphyrinogen-III synthase HemD [Estrella lausannensis]